MGAACPFLLLRVRRGQCLLSDTLLQINDAKNNNSLKKPLEVSGLAAGCQLCTQLSSVWGDCAAVNRAGFRQHMETVQDVVPHWWLYLSGRLAEKQSSGTRVKDTLPCGLAAVQAD